MNLFREAAMAVPSTTIPTLRRALLYVPASSPKMLTKSLTLAVDNVTYDLEDSVTPSLKESARTTLVEHLKSLHNNQPPSSIGEIAVRVNAVSTPHALADIAAAASSPAVSTIVVPKVTTPEDLFTVEQAIRFAARRPPSTPSFSPPQQREPPRILALIESARAVMDLRAICAALPPGRLSGLIFAAEDFALDLSLTRTASLREFAYARSAVTTAARAFGLESTIDLVCTAYEGSRGQERLEWECRDGRGLGFNGKQCIHPSQISAVQKLFSPSKTELEWAARVVVADEKASAAGRGAWTLDGKMIDAPVAGKARATLAKAERCGFDVNALKEEWGEQEPE